MVHSAVDLMHFAERLTKAWSRESSSLWSPDNPARGQCGVTSLVVQDVFGGQILKTVLQQGPHFYNSIEGRRFDFTASQFQGPIEYKDLPSDRKEAMSDTDPLQYRTLRERLGLPVND